MPSTAVSFRRSSHHTPLGYAQGLAAAQVVSAQPSRASVAPDHPGGSATMRIAVLGTGVVGRTLAGKLDELGHDAAVGPRAPDKTMPSPDTDYVGTPPYSTWAEEHPGVRLATFADAAVAADLVVN